MFPHNLGNLEAPPHIPIIPPTKQIPIIILESNISHTIKDRLKYHTTLNHSTTRTSLKSTTSSLPNIQNPRKQTHTHYHSPITLTYQNITLTNVNHTNLHSFSFSLCLLFFIYYITTQALPQCGHPQ